MSDSITDNLAEISRRLSTIATDIQVMKWSLGDVLQPRKQSSHEMSSLASRLLTLTPASMLAEIQMSPAAFMADIRSLAASVLSQTEEPKP